MLLFSLGSSLEFTAQEFPGEGDEADESMLSDDDSASAHQHKPVLQLAPHHQYRVAKRRHASEDKDNDKLLLDAILARSDTPRPEDEFESFGRSVAATLRRLQPRLQAEAKVKIQQLLLDLEFGETGADTAGLALDCS